MDREARTGSTHTAWQRWLCAATTVCAAILLATAADAQLEATQDPGQTTGADTIYTPVAKDPPEGLFKLLSGPRYQQGKSPAKDQMTDGSRAHFGSDLLDVALTADEDSENAFAVGAACADSNGDGAPDDSDTATCTRVPVIYSFSVRDGWRLDRLETEPGYVASVSIFADGKAIAVGGDGRYPRREAGEDRGHCEGDREPSTDPQDGGTARAWLYEKGSWRELSNRTGPNDGKPGDEVPDAPGFTAVDAYIPNPAKPIEFAAIGGLCQIWHWTEGSFWRTSEEKWQEPFSPQGTEDTKFRVPGLLYRAREIAFAKPVAGMDPYHWRPHAYAALSGCCADEQLAIPSYLTYSTPLEGGREKEWCEANGISTTWCSTTPDFSGRAQWPHAWDAATAGSWSGGVPMGPNGKPDPIKKKSRVKDPDSHVSATASWNFYISPLNGIPQDGVHQPFSPVGPSFISTPTGPRPELGPEPSSNLVPPSGGASAPNVVTLELAVPTTTARLNDGAGDRGGGDRTLYRAQGISPFFDTPPLASQRYGEFPTGQGNTPVFDHHNRRTATVGGEWATTPDGVPDWSVGVLRSSGQAVALGTDPAQLPPPDPAVEPLPPREQCPPRGAGPLPPGVPFVSGTDEKALCLFNRTGEHTAETVETYDPAKATSAERIQRAVSSYKLLKLPTYTLNAIDVVDREGKGYAVGDHGAIVSLSTGSVSAGKATEQSPPQLGSRQETAAPSRDDWKARLPKTAAPGQVPAAHTASRERSDHPELSIEGSPGGPPAADEIIMAPDGSEGWALGYGDGSSSPPLRASHYDGSRWTQCGDEGQEKLDPACKSIAELRDQGIKLLGADRVPNEVDSDPSNDAQLEIVAVSRTRILRYRDGRWAIEDEGALKFAGELDGLIDVAFVAPGDGMIVADDWDEETNPEAVQGKGARQVWRRFDGEQWRLCNRVVGPGGVGAGPELASDCDPHNRLPRSMDFRPGPNGPANRNCALVVADRGCVTRIFSAGERIYAVGIRRITKPCAATIDCFSGTEVSREAPVLLYRERGKPWSETPTEDEIDPGGPAGDGGAANVGDDLGFTGQPAVVRRTDGAYEGWALLRSVDNFGAPTLLRLSPSGGWAPFRDSGAHHFLSAPGARTSISLRPGGGRASPALLSQAFTTAGEDTGGQLFELDTIRLRWRLVQTPFSPTSNAPRLAQVNHSPVGWRSLADDRQGGFWSATSDGLFYRYTDRPQTPLMGEVPQPSLTGARISAIAGTKDGTLWAATRSDQLYRYDRALGWDRVRIPGWERGGATITKAAEASDVALGSDGAGLVVGERGRIGRIGADGSVALDPAAGVACDLSAPQPPCGTARDLLAVAIGPDGSAMAVGKDRATLWRPAGGELRSIEPPPVGESDSIEAVSLPEPGVVWAIAAERLWRGELTGGRWRWARQVPPHPGTPRQIALGPDERGYLITTESGRSRLLERGADGSWIRLPLPVDENRAGLRSIALPPSGGEGALVGGARGLVLTRWRDRFEVARHPSPVGDGDVAGLSPSVTSLALLPSYSDRESEAWALAPASPGNKGTDRLYHYGSSRPDGLLSTTARTEAMPDAPAAREGEISLAAFGKSDCQMGFDFPCKPMAGMLEYSQLLNERMIDEISARSIRPGGPQLALFTGDAVDSGGHAASEPAEEATGPGTTGLVDLGCGAAGIFSYGVAGCPSRYGGWRLRRWGELVADRLSDRGVPVLGAVGARDVSDPEMCSQTQCTPVRRAATTPGENLAWRRSMALRSAPWGDAPAPLARHVKLRKLTGRGVRLRQEDREVNSPAAGVPSRTAAAGGTDTNYAVDVLDSSGRRKTARLVFVDNSSGALATSDPLQQPLRPDGQAAWLDSVLCLRGEISAGTSCSRQPDQRAIVIANSPTYSYGPGAGSQTAADSAAFEAILMKNKADLVVSGRIGWNGHYWATAPGVHEPCPGEPYSQEPPSGTVCGQSVPGVAEADRQVSAATLAATVAAGDALAPTEGLTRALPFVVASGAGGRFFGGAVANAPDHDAKDGFWHGYTIARLDSSGDPRRTIVEQRPVYDWVGIEAAERSLRAGQKMLLRGFGRGPIGYYISAASEGKMFASAMVRFDRIDSAAVTHRYSLVEADPEKPWLPRRDGESGYVPLDPSIATVDAQTGQIRVGKGNNPRTFAVAMLSLGCVAERDSETCDAGQLGVHSASYPLVFEPRRTFVPEGTAAPARSAQVIVQSAQAGIAPPASPGAPPQVGSISPPVLPSFPGISAPPATPPLAQPSAAPPPPPPPVPPPPAALELAPAPPGLTVAPPASVIPPPAPPINPAPPGGARKEARQRQAATEKSGSESAGPTTEEGADRAGDMANGPPGPTGTAMTRLDRRRAEPSFTAAARADQPSGWARGALYGGGLTLAALAVAAGWTAWPRPGPRPPAVPVPASAWARRRDGR